MICKNSEDFAQELGLGLPPVAGQQMVACREVIETGGDGEKGVTTYETTAKLTRSPARLPVRRPSVHPTIQGEAQKRTHSVISREANFTASATRRVITLE